MSGPFSGADPEAREVLDARAERLAEIETAERTDGRRALVVMVEGDRYALPVESVGEIVTEYRMTPIPCAPPAVRGVVSLRGEIVSVLDLAVLLGLRAAGAFRLAPLVVVSDGTVTTALLVDAVADLAVFTSDGVDPPLPLVDDAHTEMVAGSYADDDGPVALLEPAALLVPVGGEG